MSPRRGYYSSDNPNHCHNEFIYHHAASITRIEKKIACRRKAVWLLTLTQKGLKLCHICFERYLVAHPTTDPAQIVRLSDNEADFVEHFNEEGKAKSVYW
jgi:hypothetical protein